VRDRSYGHLNPLSALDKLGEFLSIRQLRHGIKAVSNFDSLADLGSGYSANVTKPIWKKFHNVFLFDFTLDKEGLTSEESSIVFIEGDIMLTTKNFSKDLNLVVLNNVLEHVDDPVTLLKQVKRNLIPESVLFINVPSWRGKYFLEKAAFAFGLAPREEMEDHKRYYSKQELWLEIRKAGFMPSNISVKGSKFGLNVTAIVRI
jgi:SAM-dependent methyltransferase